MEMNQELFEELVKLREKLKEKAKRKGKTFNCNDKTLQEIATYLPTKISDFEGISGAGDVFIEFYSQYFIQKVQEFTAEVDDQVKLDKKGLNIIQDYERKLVNLNKRNHLLYCPKLYSKFGVDLFEATNDIRNIILSSGRTATIAKNDDKNFNSIISLLRTNTRNLREKGQNNLFVAYPFVKGKFVGDDFTIRAPLALFPIKAERAPNGIKLSLDREREVLYNQTLILANFKFNNINSPLPENNIEDTSKDNFIYSLADFYKENKISITLPEDLTNLIPFENYTSETFPNFKKGEFYLENSAVLGLFSITDSSIQNDFQKIAETKRINKLLNDLLENKDFEDSEYNEDQEISENEITYINKLDAAQENVIATLAKTDELVVQGPPGTGKSQTITSLIADFALKGKSILLVSEKKTALDVVYSRLGNLSKYALILDDVNDKLSFYSQMETMYNQQELPAVTQEGIEECETQIDSDFAKLKQIGESFFTVDDFGIEPYNLYLLNDIQSVTQKENLKKIRKLTDILGEDYKYFTYNDCVENHSFFENLEHLTKADSFITFEKEIPWLSKTKKNLTDFEISSIDIDIEKIEETKTEHKKLPFMKKIFGKNQVKIVLTDFCNRYFSFDEKNQKRQLRLSKKQANFFYRKKNYVKLADGLSNYKTYWEVSDFYSTLSDTSKNYFDLIQKIEKTYSKENLDKNTALIQANKDLFEFLPAKHLIEIEAKYRDVLPSLENYDSILKSIDSNMNKKREMEKKNLENILSQQISIISHSKRRADILKQIESKRKWSVNKFVNKFNFELFNAVKIWLLTPEVVSEIIPLETGFFDLVVFDEASQMFVEKGIPSILRGKKVVIAGDQKQLRPSTLFSGRFQLDEDNLEEDQELSVAADEDSLLDLAHFKYDNVLLNFHYRSAFEELIAFSNYAFYDAKLCVSPNKITPELPPIEVHKIEDGLWVNRANEAEAQVIVQLIKDFFANRKENETIGIITFNTNQRDKIDDLLDKECEKDENFAKLYNAELTRKNAGEDIGLFVKNIETVQGDERDVIIFSMGYAKNEEGKFIQNFGWLNQSGGENRLNVAVSRAKKKIHIVVSFEPEQLKTESAKNKGPSILKKYLQYAFAVSEKDSEKAKRLLEENLKEKFAQNIPEITENPNQKEMAVVKTDTEFTTAEKIAEAQNAFEFRIEQILKNHGYDFDRNVGIGGYTIDFAVKDSGEYILGLECDGKLYSSYKNVRQRDYYRPKYLELRGWKILRLWSLLWQKNPQKAEEKLIAELAKLTK